MLNSLQSLRSWQEQGKRGIPLRKKSRTALSQLCHQRKPTTALWPQGQISALTAGKMFFTVLRVENLIWWALATARRFSIAKSFLQWEINARWKQVAQGVCTVCVTRGQEGTGQEWCPRHMALFCHYILPHLDRKIKQFLQCLTVLFAIILAPRGAVQRLWPWLLCKEDIASFPFTH